MNWMLVVQFLVLMAVVVGPIIYFLHRTLVSSTDGAVKRLNEEAEKTRKKQTELNLKIKEADEELAKRRAEADALAQKMIQEAEQMAKDEREKLIQKAREEGEDIITRAMGTKDKIRKEIEKEMELKLIGYSAKILTTILSQKAKGVLDQQLINEFIEGLEKLDMSKISTEIVSAEIVTISALDNMSLDKILKILKTKLKREMKLTTSTDSELIAGMALRFGSLGIDGSLRNSIKEIGTTLKQRIEEQAV